jgi:hypothetical protein
MGHAVVVVVVVVAGGSTFSGWAWDCLFVTGLLAWDKVDVLSMALSG